MKTCKRCTINSTTTPQALHCEPCQRQIVQASAKVLYRRKYFRRSFFSKSAIVVDNFGGNVDKFDLGGSDTKNRRD